MKTKIKFPNVSTPSLVSGMKKNGKDVLYLKRNGVTYYTKHFKVTTNLTGVSLASYDAPMYKEPLSLSFVPDTGLQLLPSTVNVTMGGVDITDISFNILTNTIEIQSVTGNVVITATAAVVDMNYQPLLCIFTREKGSGSNAPSNGIILPYKPSSNTKLELDVFLASYTYSMLYNAAERNPNTSASYSYPQFYFWVRYTNTNSYRIAWGVSTNSTNSISNRMIQTQKRIKVICDRGTFTYENYLGSIQSFKSSSTLTSWNVDNKLCIFAENRFGSGKTASYNCFGGLYRCMASDYNSTTGNYDLVLDCIPVKRRSDGKLGIYDLVSGTAIINDRNTMPSDRYMGPNILTTASLTNCTRTLLSAAETGTATRAVIGSTWSVKLTPNTNTTFNSNDAVISLIIGGVDVTNLTNDDTAHTPYVQYDSAADTYTITIVNVPQESIEISASAVEIVETEYVESDGLGFIASSYIPGGSNIKIIAKINLVRYSTSGKWLQWFGAYTSEQANCYRIIRSSNFNTHVLINNNTPAGTGGTLIQISLNSIHEIELAFGTCKIDGVSHSLSQSSSTVANTGVIRLAGAGTVGRYYYMQIYDGEDLKLDLIPVRVGTRAGMKDNVSGKIFYPSGTSAWTYKDLNEVSDSITPNGGLTLDNDEEETI